MKIRINHDNRNKIQAAVELPRVRERDISAETVFAITDRAEKHLRGLLPKKYCAGTTLRVDHHAQQFPNAYRGAPQSTQIEITWTASGAFLTGVWRGDCRRPKHQCQWTFTPEARDEIFEQMSYKRI